MEALVWNCFSQEVQYNCTFRSEFYIYVYTILYREVHLQSILRCSYESLCASVYTIYYSYIYINIKPNEKRNNELIVVFVSKFGSRRKEQGVREAFMELSWVSVWRPNTGWDSRAVPAQLTYTAMESPR